MADENVVGGSNFFTTGWIPSLGWVCVVAIAFDFMIFPFIEWSWSAYHPEAKKVDLPDLEVHELVLLVGVILGVGGLKTFERTRGDTKDKI